MRFLKKYWYFLILAIVTLGMGVVALITSGKLTNINPVAPTVPQITPKAAEACTLTFNLATPTATPPGDTPTNTPGDTPTNTPTPATCNNSCTVNSDCAAGLICSGNSCRNPDCTGETDCSCNAAATPTPTPPATCNNNCSVNSDCLSGLICSGNSCRNSNCTGETDCSCPGVSTPTPTTTEIAAAPTPKTPIAGMGPSVLGASIIGSGLLLILLGLAL